MAVTPQFPGYRLTPGVFDQRTVLRGREVIDDRAVINPDDWLRSTTWADQWAVRFDGISTRGQCSIVGFPSAAGSLSAWVRINSALTTGLRYGFAQPSAGNNFWISFFKPSGGNDLAIRIGSATAPGNGYTFTRTSPAGYNTGQWYHFLGTYNGTTFTAYIDGVSIGSQAIAELRLPATSFWLAYDGTTNAPIDMSEISVWNRAVSVAEVNDGGQPVDIRGASGLLYHWPCGDGYRWNSLVIDDIADGKNMTWTNGTQTTQIVAR